MEKNRVNNKTILLVRPLNLALSPNYTPIPPIGLLSLGTILKGKGYNVKIVDAIKEPDYKQKIADYAKKAKNKSLIKRLGYLLERNNKQTFGLKPLDNNYVILDYLSKKRGKKDKKWKVAVNI